MQLALLLQGKVLWLKQSFMPIVSLVLALSLYYIFFSAIALRRRKVSSDIQLRTGEAAAAEQVRYSTGGSVVWLGQNVAYDAVEYPDETVYEDPSTWEDNIK